MELNTQVNSSYILQEKQKVRIKRIHYIVYYAITKRFAFPTISCMNTTPNYK